MAVQLFRIDDRLIHGQVVIGWAKPLNCQRIVLCDNDVAINEWERKLYTSCISEKMESLFFTTKQTASYLSDNGHDQKRTIVLLKSPKDALEVIDSGYKPLAVNLGGLHYAPERKEYLPYIFLSKEDISDLKSITSKGIPIFCQDIPTGKKYNIAQLIARG
jgi:mannose/fructose/N-acetylgalactosamine-specific phosphotransferase system component IIB